MKSKKLKRSDLYIGKLVVCSDHPEVQVRTVSHLFPNSSMVELQWYEGTNHCSQGVDCQLYEPTSKQVEHSICNNGKLMPCQELLDF
jgi:hypothetical protein